MSVWLPSDRDRDRTVATLRLLVPALDGLLFFSLFFPPLPEAFAVAFLAIG
jgi:hypothetical protein